MSKIRSAQNVASSYISTSKVFPFTAICCGKVVRDPLPIAVHVFINKSHISLHAAFIATSLSLVLFGLCRLFLPSLTHYLAFLFSHFFFLSRYRGIAFCSFQPSRSYQTVKCSSGHLKPTRNNNNTAIIIRIYPYNNIHTHKRRMCRTICKQFIHMDMVHAICVDSNCA